MDKIKLTINILDKVVIKMTGDEKITKNIKEYFPDMESELSPDYILDFKGMILEYPKVNEEKRIKSFKGTQYYIKKEYSISYNSEFSSEHIIYKNENKFDIYVFGEDYEMIFIRMCREIMFRILFKEGYIPLHAAAVLKGNRASVFTGQSGNGKSTCFLYNTLLENGRPIANDILMYKKENEKVNIIGIPYKVSVSSEFFNKYNLKYENNIDTNSDKIKYSIRDFCKTYNRKWCWNAELGELYLLDYENENLIYETMKISEKEFLNRIEKIYNEEIFEYGDFLELGGELNRKDKDLYEYAILLKGNVIEYFNKRNIDMHIHLRKALCSYDLLKVYLRECINNGIKEVLFLDHGDRISQKHKPYLYDRETMENYNNKIYKIRNEKSNIIINSGIEVDFSYNKEFQNKVISDIHTYKFSYVIGSIHNMNKLSEQEYFKAVLDMIKIYPIDIIGHMKMRENYKKCENEIRKIFNEIRENRNNIKVEINTSDRSVWNDDQLRFMMDLMKEYNIDYTIGSDAHSENEIGYNIKNMIGRIREIGW